MQAAVKFCLAHPVTYVAQHRSQVLKYMIAKGKHLKHQEVPLKNGILQPKNMHLFKELLLEAGSRHVNLADDVCVGFDLNGKLPASNHVHQKYRPASLPTFPLRA
jgi:hypothetical protein